MAPQILDRADVVVVGGGTMGVATAYFLAQKGLDVVVLERERLAWGASGRNAGFLWMHTRNPGIAVDLSRAGLQLIDELAPELGGTIEYRRKGGMIFFNTDAQKRVFEEFAEQRTQQGVTIEVLDEVQARELAPLLPRDAIGATYCPDDGQIRSPAFVRGLAGISQRMGVRVYEHTAVLKVLTEADRVTGVRTVAGDVLADRVVWATGAWAGQLEAAAGIEVPVRPSRIGVLLTEPVRERLEVVMFGPGSAKQYSLLRDLPSFRLEDFVEPWEDLDCGYEYNELIAQRDDGRLQIGNPEDDQGGFDQRTPMIGMKMMVDAFIARWPHLAGLSIDDQWSGLIPVTPDALPIVGPVGELEGLFVIAGHIFGNIAGPSSGKLMAELVNGEDPSLDIDGLRLDRPALQHGFAQTVASHGTEADGAFIRW